MASFSSCLVVRNIMSYLPSISSGSRALTSAVKSSVPEILTPLFLIADTCARFLQMTSTALPACAKYAPIAVPIAPAP